jgi:hypothetical protein
MTANLAILRELEKKVLWLASWTVHNTNHLRENSDGLKVGGHQASSASLTTITDRCLLLAQSGQFYCTHICPLLGNTRHLPEHRYVWVLQSTSLKRQQRQLT